jgi:hypothetical protein
MSPEITALRSSLLNSTARCYAAWVCHPNRVTAPISAFDADYRTQPHSPLVESRRDVIPNSGNGYSLYSLLIAC